MKKIAWLFVFTFMIMFAVTSASAEVKIGVVDLIRALNESDTGKKAKGDLEFIIKSKQVTIDEKGKALEKLKGDLEKQASVLSAEARRSKEEELQRLILDYQRLVNDSQNEVKKKENEFTGEIVKEIKAILEKIGQEEGYTMIIENADGIILYSKKENDLTDIVIKKYNESKVKK